MSSATGGSPRSTNCAPRSARPLAAPGPGPAPTFAPSPAPDFAAVAEIRTALRPEDGLWVICLGHCHHDGRQAWWNLPGPDITATEFGKLFAGITCREQVFVMTMSLSGFFVAPLSRRDRVVIAATEADAETNETRFPGVFAQLLAGGLNAGEHDVDKDGKLTLFDLYVVVAKEIAQNYDRPVTVEEVEDALHVVQKLDPPGCGARTLAECLAENFHQVERFGRGVRSGKNFSGNVIFDGADERALASSGGENRFD